MLPFNTVIKNARICVIGDIMLDHYIQGTCERISPEAPVQIVNVRAEDYSLGGAGNVLRNLETFGATGSLISICGNDDASKILTDKLASIAGCFFHLEKDETRCSTIKSRVSVNRHQLIRLDKEDKHYCDRKIADSIINVFKSIAPQTDILIISDYCKGVLTDYLAQSLINICLQHHIISIVDSKNKDLSKYKGAGIIKPNRKEAALASGITINDDNTLQQACEKICAITECKTVIVTLSEDGIAIYNQHKLQKIPTRAIEVYDVTGAGDTVIAALAFALANGATIIDACNFANYAAAIVVAKFGSATATLQEIQKLGNYNE